MQGSIAQSYFIFDNPKFKVARKIYFGLAGEEQELRGQQEIDDINEYNSGSEDFEYDEEGEEETEEMESALGSTQEALLKDKSIEQPQKSRPAR